MLCRTYVTTCFIVTACLKICWRSCRVRQTVGRSATVAAPSGLCTTDKIAVDCDITNIFLVSARKKWKNHYGKNYIFWSLHTTNGIIITGKKYFLVSHKIKKGI